MWWCYNIFWIIAHCFVVGNNISRYDDKEIIYEKIVSQQWIDCFQETACADGYTCVKLPFSQKESFGKMRKSISLPLSPLEWFAIIKNSSGYVGNNMHPIVVSLHTGTPFFSFDNYGIKKFNGLLASDQSSKIKHILHYDFLFWV